MVKAKLTTALLLGMAALLAGGCAPLTDDDGGGSSSGCLASITQDDSGAQIAINTPNIAVGGSTGSTTQLAEAFLATVTQVVPEVELKLDAVAPSGTQLGSTVRVSIVQDSLTTTAGTATVPTTPLSAAITSGSITASGTFPAASISAGATSGAANPAFYDFCFTGAIGVNCPTSGTGATTAGVTLNAGQYYWVVVTTDSAGTATSFVEWRGTKTTTPDFFGFVNLNGLGSWLPVNGTGTTNFNFDFKLGC